MTDEEKEILVRQFLDDELDSKQEKEALQMMAEESELRDLLHLEISLNRSFQETSAESRSFQVPADFSDNVMEAIEAREEAEVAEERSSKQSDIWQRVRQAIDSIFEPRPVRWRPVYGLAAAVAAIAIILALNIGIDSSKQQVPQIAQKQQMRSSQSNRTIKAAAAASTKQQPRVWTRFYYVSNDAHSVAVAGDFSNWEPIPLNKKQVNGQTVWTGKVQMKKGEHRYMYLINGDKWKTDPLAQRYVKDGFGNRNAVLSL